MSSPVISFDAAGTLIQVNKPVGATYASIARRHGITVEETALKAAFRQAWGRVPAPQWPEGTCAPDDDKGWWRQLVAEVFHSARSQPLTEAELEPLFEDLYAHFAQPEAWTVFEDVLPALTDLKQDHRLCVLSNFDRRLRSILSGHGLEGFFDQIILSSEVGTSKPHPRMYETARRLMDADVTRSWHVGDDRRCDEEGASACGWNAFLVARPQQGLADFVEKVRFQANISLHISSERVGSPPHPRR